MSESNTSTNARVQKFAFRSFEGTRRGRIYRLWVISWQWWVHQWERSRVVKFLIGIIMFSFVFANLVILMYADPSLTTNDLFEKTMLGLVRSLVTNSSLPTSGTSADVPSLGLSGFSLAILILVALVGSGLIADDLSDRNIEIFYSKLARHEYVLGKFGAFLLFGNLCLTLPFILEFFLLVISLGDIDLIAALPVLFTVILYTEIIIITYASIILAFSSLTNRRLYAGLSAFMFPTVFNAVVPSLAMTGDDTGFIFLFDVLTLLLLTSYLMMGIEIVQFQTFEGIRTINLADGLGIENWMVLGALGVYILVGFLIVIIQVYWRHTE